MQVVQWGVCLSSVKFLANMMQKFPSRESCIVKTICHILQSFRFALPDAVKTTVGDATEENGVAQNVIKMVDKCREDREESKDEDESDEKPPYEDVVVEVDEKKKLSADDEKKLSALRASIARSVKAVVLPILQRLLLQKDKQSSDLKNVDDGTGIKKKKGPRGSVRIGVISVMLHVLRFLPVSDFHSKLPRLVSHLIDGLMSRELDHRRAARHATTHVVKALGSAYLPWLIREMRPRMTRGFAVPVLMATAHMALQSLMDDPMASSHSRLSKDMNDSVAEFMPLVEAEVERLSDPSRLEGEADEHLPKTIPEARRVRGPEVLKLLAQRASPDCIAAKVIQHLYMKLLDDRVENENWNTRGSMSVSMKFLRRIEELIRSALTGLCQNPLFHPAVQLEHSERMMKLCGQLLRPQDFGTPEDRNIFRDERERQRREKQVGSRGWISAKRDTAITVQPGAAAGRGAWHGAKKADFQKGFDVQARAQVIGVAGLKLMQKAFTAQLPPSSLDKAEALLPLVVVAFTSSQDVLFSTSARVLYRLLAVFSTRPEIFEPFTERIAVTVLNTFRRASGQQQLSARMQKAAQARGLGLAGGPGVVNTCTMLLSALLRKEHSADWFNRVHSQEIGTLEDIDKEATKAVVRQTFLEALLSQIQTSLDHTALQPSALQLLSRVLIRKKVEMAAVYSCVEMVGEVLIRGGDRGVSKQCSQVYVDFMLDYPHADAALQKKISFLVRNLGYNEEGGRRSVLNALHSVVLQFPLELLNKRFAALIFVPAAARLPQEPDEAAHKMLEILLVAVLERVDGTTRNGLINIVLKWQSSEQPLLRAALAEVIGLVARVPGDLLVPRLPVLLPALRALAPEEPLPGAPDKVHWRLVYCMTNSFEKILAHLPRGSDLERALKPVDAEVTFFWDMLIEGIGSHPHPWVRAVALRLLEQYVTKTPHESFQPKKPHLLTRGAVNPLGLNKSLCELFGSDFLEENPALVPSLVRGTLGLMQLVVAKPWIVTSVVTPAEDESDAGSDLEDASSCVSEAEEIDAEQAIPEAAEPDAPVVDALPELPVTPIVPEESDDENSPPNPESEDEGPELVDEPSDTLFERVDSALEPTALEEVVTPAVEPADLNPEVLRQTRVRWAVVRLSFTARGFLRKPQTHVVGLASIFRFFGALSSTLAPPLVESLLDALLSPLYRAIALGKGRGDVQVGDISSTGQLLSLSTAERLAFIGGLAQTVLDHIEQRLGATNAAYAKALQHVRRVVTKLRRDRVVALKRELVADPEKAAKRKLQTNKKKAELKKRNLKEKIRRDKGGTSGMVSKHRLRP